MEIEIKEIDEIDFGILSSEEIVRMSVAEIHKNRLTSNKNKDEKDGMEGSLYDHRMGPMESKQICITCTMKTKDCMGHFGHINLNIKVVHPLFYRMVLSFLKCVCIQCSKLLITDDHLKLWNFHRFKGEQRFSQILSKVIKIRFCIHCTISQPKYTLITQEGSFIATYKTSNNTDKIKLSTDEISNIFSKITDDDICLLGFDPSKTRPINLVLTVLPVIPPRARPFIVTDNNISDDDITLTYSELIKANNNLKTDNISESKRQKYIDTLIFRIKTLFDNSAGRSKHTNSRPLKGFKERLCGKDGLIRGNLMGKRQDFSARTVIGPDPTLRLNEIAVPEEICQIESFPDTVNRWNIEKLQKLVWEGKINMIDKKCNDKQSLKQIRRIHVKYVLKGDENLRKKLCTLEIGDIAHRQLMKGDVVLLNRQPSLHGGSMLAKKIIPRPGKTIRMNLATTSSFNADFDGDNK